MLFELPSFKHIDAMEVKEAVSYLREYGEKARVVAGGTDLLSLMKDRIEGPELKIPELLINIKTIPEINRITYSEEIGLRIGAAVTLNRLAASDVINQKYNILSQAARQVGTTQTQEYGHNRGEHLSEASMPLLQTPSLSLFQEGG